MDEPDEEHEEAADEGTKDEQSKNLDKVTDFVEESQLDSDKALQAMSALRAQAMSAAERSSDRDRRRRAEAARRGEGEQGGHRFHRERARRSRARSRGAGAAAKGGELEAAMSELVHLYDSHGRQYDADGKLLSQHIFECPSPFYSSEWATAEEPKDKEEPKKEGEARSPRPPRRTRRRPRERRAAASRSPRRFLRAGGLRHVSGVVGRTRGGADGDLGATARLEVAARGAAS